MSRGVLSTAWPGLISRLLRIDDWRSIELWADVLVIDRGVWRETVALDKVIDWTIASRPFWSELRLRLHDGRQVSCAVPRGDGRSAGRAKAPCWASAATTFWRCLDRWAKL